MKYWTFIFGILLLSGAIMLDRAMKGEDVIPKPLPPEPTPAFSYMIIVGKGEHPLIEVHRLTGEFFIHGKKVHTSKKDAEELYNVLYNTLKDYRYRFDEVAK
jgi:hypothetical protein